MLDQAKLAALVAANVAKAVSPNSNIMEITVNRCSPAKPIVTKTGAILETVRLDTTAGTFWPIKSSLVNLPTDFRQPVKCMAVVTVRTIKNAQGQDVEVLNLSSAEFQGLDNEKALAIRQMPKGTALFASL